MRQLLSPARKIFYAGESVTFVLDALPAAAGVPILRTNLDRGAVRRRELIEAESSGSPPPGLDWHDMKMNVEGKQATLTLALTETGIFEAKCCFQPSDGSALLWAEGENFKLKVESADSGAGDIIYCAFVRQFGPNLFRERSIPEKRDGRGLDAREHTSIPPSGSFRKLKQQLNHIFDELGCTILQLLPIHPVPTRYGRMGVFGSPFAALDYFSVESALAEFDPRVTPMEQFEELIDAVHAKNGRLFMDIPVNHTGWASKLQNEHPEYFVRSADGTFESPGAWGVVWEDLCKLDYRHPEVSRLMAKVFLFWCRRGVDGFRCDAGYMVPEAAWNYIVARVRAEYPDTVFLLEGLGGKTEVQERLLGNSGLDWGYSELFQNFSRDEISNYLPYMNKVGENFGNLVSFAETHDNTRLASVSKAWAKSRFFVTGLLSSGGAFGFANGAEFFAAERVDVHQDSALHYGNPENLNAEIAGISALLRTHPAFGANSRIELIQYGSGNVIAAERKSADGRTRALVLLNLEPDRSQELHFSAELPGRRDLLSGRDAELVSDGENRWKITLAPGEAFCLGRSGDVQNDWCNRKRELAMSKRALRALRGNCVDEPFAGKLSASPEAFLSALSGMKIPPLTHWDAAADARRIVVLPVGDLLLVQSLFPFRCELSGDEDGSGFLSSIPCGDGRNIVLLTPGEVRGGLPRRLRLNLREFLPAGKVRKLSGEILQMPPPECLALQESFSGAEADARDLCAFGANDAGSYALFSARWGEKRGKYEALFAAGDNPEHPVDRTVYFSRCRAWLVVNGYSQEINIASLAHFSATAENSAKWIFHVPVGQGCRTKLEITFRFALRGEGMKLGFFRHKADCECSAPDATEVKLILRPDLEARINHELTQAFLGAEERFPAAVKSTPSGFGFTPAGRTFSMSVDRGGFRPEPEWSYMNDLPAERHYGLGDKTDLFSPGYFEIPLPGESGAELFAGLDPRTECVFPEAPVPAAIAPNAAVALERFVVRRDGLHTVIAGYPWFLDWGRDTLIALRGLLRAERFRDRAAEILRAFAGFEENGTIPNMIRGNDVGNRDTSDAPLWLIVAVRDYVEVTGNRSLLDADCRGRSMKEILHSIIFHYRKGTPNGIHVDPESGLVFSPSHFTWMDTNFPAGTPRQGYPVEIQALWYAALKFLGEEKAAETVAASMEKLFFALDEKHCSDCLHAEAGTPAVRAVPDDHRRPNQLFAVTLGALKKFRHTQAILSDCEALLVPGGIRSLADRETHYELPVQKDGRVLNDPRHPYNGSYAGPEDTSRKVAYHNGTVWCWPFPSYCEALFLAGGSGQKKRALSLLLSAAEDLERGVLRQLPEVADGDAPHAPGGCPAQAWSLSEFFRVYELLK